MTRPNEPLQPARWRGLWALLAYALSSCIEAPDDPSRLHHEDESVLLSGIVSSSGAAVQVYAAPSASGPFTPVTTTVAATLPRNPGSSLAVFEWSVRAAIPRDLWTSAGVTDEAGCALRGTYVRVSSGGTNLRPTPDAPPEQALRLLAYPTHVGDVVLATQAEANAHSCTGKIDGKLQVGSPGDYKITLPRLAEVSGAVELSYPGHPLVTPTGGCLEVRRYHLPELTSVGDDLTLTASLGVSDEAVDFGLSSLKSVEGTIRVNVTNAQTALAGLENVDSVGGIDLQYQSDVGSYGTEFTAIDGVCTIAPARPPLLDGLTVVQGNVRVHSPSDSYGVLPHVSLVTGDVLIEAKGTSGILPALTVVKGNLTFGSGSFQPALLALNTVQGELRIEGSGHASWPLRAAGAPVVVSGLRIVGNSNLASLTPSTLLFSPLLSAPLRIQENPLLTSAQICAFVAAQRATGWNGPVTLDPGLPCAGGGLTFSEIAREFTAGLHFLEPEPRPGLNAGGTVTFVGYDVTMAQRIFSGNGTAPVVNVALAPHQISQVTQIKIDTTGQIALTATRTPAVGVAQRGLYATNTTGSVFQTLHEGPVIPDEDDPVVRPNLALSPNGTVLFSTIRNGHGALYRGPLSGVPSVLRSATGQFYNSGALDVNDAGLAAVQLEYSQFMLTRGVLLFSTPNPTFATLQAAVHELGIGTQPAPAINASGQVALVLPALNVQYRNADGSPGPLVSYQAGVYVATPSPMNTPANLTLIAGLAGPYSSFGAVDINDAGTVVFEAGLDAGEFGIFYGPDPVAHKVAKSGETLGTTFISWLRMGELNNAGQLAFMTSDFKTTDRQVWRAAGIATP